MTTRELRRKTNRTDWSVLTANALVVSVLLGTALLGRGTAHAQANERPILISRATVHVGDGRVMNPADVLSKPRSIPSPR